jgi:uncharacterized membrane protein YtjA (UPF0391 family)
MKTTMTESASRPQGAIVRRHAWRLLLYSPFALMAVLLGFGERTIEAAAAAVACLLFGFLFVVLQEEPVKTRMRDLDKYPIAVEGERLVQRRSDGRFQAEIRLDEPFNVSIVHRGSGEGVYRVEQGGRVLDFSSNVPEAETIVTRVLRFPTFPPDGYLNPL